MSDTITVRGYVATEVRSTTADSGLAIASFRMCTTERRYDRDAGSWVDGQTNWYSVSLFRQLATNAAFSVHKGDRVIVTGRLKVRQWALDDGRSGTSVDIDAESIGHDLMWGTASYRRNVQDRASTSPSGLEEPATDDLPADLDVETGELIGADGNADGSADGGGEHGGGNGGPADVATDDGPDDPFAAAEVSGRGHGTMGG